MIMLKKMVTVAAATTGVAGIHVNVNMKNAPGTEKADNCGKKVFGGCILGECIRGV